MTKPLLNDVVTIVSGLPRSGTSMMMKMLEAGGMEVLTDQIRQADDDNPGGYYEFEVVKQLKEGNFIWLPEARGKVVKVIATLITHLPEDYVYQVVFMKRAMSEILASQRKMLLARGKDPNTVPDQDMHKIFEKHLSSVLSWMDNQPHLNYLTVNYNDLLLQPSDHIQRIRTFLGGKLDAIAMANVVDPQLYRQRFTEK